MRRFITQVAVASQLLASERDQHRLRAARACRRAVDDLNAFVKKHRAKITELA